MSTRALKRRLVHPAGGQCPQRGAAALILLLMLMLGAASILLGAFGGNDRMRRQGEALQTLGQAREALLGYAASHGRLPRPALSATDGLELADPCDSEQHCTGFLPWATLGLPPAYARGLPLRYSVTPAFAADSGMLSTAVATKTIARRSGPRLLYQFGNTACGRESQCLPAVLLASGKAQGGRFGDQADNARASQRFIQRPSSDDERQYGAAFDDLLGWVTYSELRLRLIAAGRWQ